MLTTLEVFSDGVVSVPFPVDFDAPVVLDPIQIKNIDGLGPVAAIVNTDQYGSIDGESLNSMSVPKRNIVLTVVLNPDYASQTFEALRMILYNYFMPKKSVRLQFSSTHMARVQISGVVESCEPNFFSKDPEYQISIICPDPYFVATGETTVGITTTATGSVTTYGLTYEGNVDTGFILQISGPAGYSVGVGFPARMFTLTPVPQVWDIALCSFDAATMLEASTKDKNKYANQQPYSPPGSPANILDQVVPGSVWWKLKPGINNIGITTGVPGALGLIRYFALYGGL